jgi:hypothetical protein
MIVDDESANYTKHSYSSLDQKRIHYIKLKKEMQREEQKAKQNQDIEMKSDNDSDDGKIKKKKREHKTVKSSKKKIKK